MRNDTEGELSTDNRASSLAQAFDQNVKWTEQATVGCRQKDREPCAEVQGRYQSYAHKFLYHIPHLGQGVLSPDPQATDQRATRDSISWGGLD
jgi:hypothetical protein